MAADETGCQMERCGAISRETMGILKGLNWGNLTYDEAFKLIFSEKTILALILRDCVGGYEGMTLEEIAACITSDLQASAVPLGPGRTNALDSPLRVRGGATEETIPYEGRSTFDFYFEAVMPENGNLVGINVDVEGEASYAGAGYEMASRAQFYCARLISSQCERSFSHSKYDDIKPVYSVWVFVSCPDELRGKIIATKTSWISLDGSGEVPPDPRALSTIVFAFLDNDANGAGRPDIIGVLETLLSRKMPWREKCSIIEETTGIDLAPQLEAGKVAR